MRICQLAVLKYHFLPPPSTSPRSVESVQPSFNPTYLLQSVRRLSFNLCLQTALQLHPKLTVQVNDYIGSSINVCLLNAQNLVNKISDFQSFVYSSNYSIICCTETWLCNTIFNNEILPMGYSVYRKDRLSRGGGVLVAVKEGIPCSVLSSPSELEVVTVNIGSLFTFTLSTIYIPPSSPNDYHRSMIDYLKSVSFTSTNVVLAGDFNYPDIKWAALTDSTASSNLFCDYVSKGAFLIY